MIPTVGSFLSFFRAVFTGAAATVGGLLVTAGQALSRLGQRLKGLNQPTAQGFQPAPAPAQRAQPGDIPVGGKPYPPAPLPSTAIPPGRNRPFVPGMAPEYLDGMDAYVRSSWIAGLNFKPFGMPVGTPHSTGKKGFLANAVNRIHLREKGDFTLILIKPSMNNPSARYTYPRVNRSIMDAMLKAASKGKFYWWGGDGSPALRSFSSRPLVGMRMRMKRRLASLGSKNRAQSKQVFKSSGRKISHSAHQRTSTTPIRAIPTFRTFK